VTGPAGTRVEEAADRILAFLPVDDVDDRHALLSDYALLRNWAALGARRHDRDGTGEAVTDDIATIREALDAIPGGRMWHVPVLDALDRVAARLAAESAAFEKCKEFLAAEAVRAAQAERERDKAQRDLEIADEDHDIVEEHNRDRAEAAEARVRELTDALEPFAKYRRWQTARGQKTKPPALGPNELDAAVRALAGDDAA
jgi:hypothetical protein